MPKNLLICYYLHTFAPIKLNIMAELRIKEICKQKGITQQELAKRMNVTQAGISKMLNRNITLQCMEEIAQALDVSITDLFVPEGNATKLTCPHCGMPIEICIK